MHAIVLMVLFFAASAVHGVIVTNIAFTPNPVTYLGPAVIGDAGDAWTPVSTLDGSSVVLPGGLTVAVTTDDQTIYATGVTFGGMEDILTNYAYAFGVPLTVTLGGLNPVLSYDLVPIASLDSYFDGSQKTATATGANSLSANLTNNSSTTSFVAGVNYVELLGVTPNASGQIVLTLQSDVGLNALQVSAIPEPSTFSLLGCALVIGLGIFRRPIRR